MKFDLEFDWHLTDACNFECAYCHPNIKIRANRSLPHNLTVKEVAESFNNLDAISHILMSGGEPFLFPDFIGLCERLTQENYITINTNLSTPNVKEFAKRIDPKHVVRIYPALHILEREKLGIPISNFAEDVRLLQNKGFNTTVYYVLYPPLLERFEDDLNRLVDMGISSVACKVFKGVYNGRLYPEGYSPEEKEKITSYTKSKYKFTKPYLAGDRCFKGRLCKAGMKSFKIEVDGNALRCQTVKGNYGNIYNGTLRPDLSPQPCTAKNVLAISWCHRFLVTEAEKMLYE